MLGNNLSLEYETIVYVNNALIPIPGIIISGVLLIKAINKQPTADDIAVAMIRGSIEMPPSLNILALTIMM